MASPPFVGRILVTGGAGYIGSVATHMLVSQGFNVTVLDDCSTGHSDAVPVTAKFVQASLDDRGAIREALEGCTAVMHFAGKSLVNESVAYPDIYKHVNVEGSRHLLDEMQIAGISRLVFSSSASTYGEPDVLPIAENAKTEPTNPYGETKLAIESMISEGAKSRNLAAVSFRYFNVAGALKAEGKWIGERHNPETHLIPNALQSTTDNPVKLFGRDWKTPDGTCIRDYVHVIDLVEAHISALLSIKPSVHRILNLGSGRGYSVQEILDAASHVLGRAIPYADAPVREGDPAVLVADISRAKSELNWAPKRDLMKMIEDSAHSMGLAMGLG